MDRFRAQLPQTDLRFFSYWDLLPDEAPLGVLDTRSAPGHAQEFETSAMKYIAPRKVHAELVEHPEALKATRKKGRALMDLVVEALASYLRALAAGTDRMVAPVSWVAGEVKRGFEWHPFVSRGTSLPQESQGAPSLPTETYE
jgi:creatinine amidohydrolase/Fe(II)-dependent formamide hydrolase-like protein